MSIKIPAKLKNPTFWAGVLGAAAGFLAGQTPLPEAIKSVIDALFQ